MRLDSSGQIYAASRTEVGFPDSRAPLYFEDARYGGIAIRAPKRTPIKVARIVAGETCRPFCAIFSFFFSTKDVERARVFISYPIIKPENIQPQIAKPI